MAREQGDFGPGGGIVEPDADAAAHRYPRAVGRIGHRAVATWFTSTMAAVPPSSGLRKVNMLCTGRGSPASVSSPIWVISFAGWFCRGKSNTGLFAVCS